MRRLAVATLLLTLTGCSGADPPGPIRRLAGERISVRVGVQAEPGTYALCLVLRPQSAEALRQPPIAEACQDTTLHTASRIVLIAGPVQIPLTTATGLYDLHIDIRPRHRPPVPVLRLPIAIEVNPRTEIRA